MKIIVISENETGYVLECNNRKVIVSREKNELSAKELYNLLDYKSGDKYDIKKNYGEENKDILDLIFDMLFQIVEKINLIETVEKSVDDDINDVR